MGMAAGRLWNDCIQAASESARIYDDKPGITLNPWAEARKSRAVKDQIKPRVGYLQPAQWASLFARTENTRRAAFYALGCLAGLRLQEALMLRVGLDVDLSGRGRIRVQPRGGEHAWKPKTARSVRDVPMTPTLRRILERHMDGLAGERYLLVHDRCDRPISPDTITHWVKSDFPAAGLKLGRAGDGLTYHSLRHTFASWAVQEGESILKVARVMGDTAAMIERVYGHLAPTDLETVTDAVERKIGGHIHQNSHRISNV
jgi:integrase